MKLHMPSLKVSEREPGSYRSQERADIWESAPHDLRRAHIQVISSQRFPDLTSTMGGEVTAIGEGAVAMESASQPDLIVS